MKIMDIIILSIVKVNYNGRNKLVKTRKYTSNSVHVNSIMGRYTVPNSAVTPLFEYQLFSKLIGGFNKI